MKAIFAGMTALLFLLCDAASVGETQEAAVKPSVRAGHCLVYDEQQRKVALLDGYQPPHQPELGEVWAWGGKEWKIIPGAGPTARFYGSAVYDARRKRIVSYGGLGHSGLKDLRSDTWEWDGKTWRQMADTSAGARFLHVMAYDAARGKTVMYGGVRLNGAHVTDTWEWDGVKWSQIAAPGPGGRSHSAMVYDSRRKKVVLFGGVDGNNAYNDTWTWDGKAWQKVSEEGPPGRVRHAMAFDSRAGEILMYGGGVNRIEQADMWQWDGVRWTEIKMTGPTPGKRSVHAMAYDAARGRTVLYGGQQRGSEGAKILNDTWAWDGKQWAKVSGA